MTVNLHRWYLLDHQAKMQQVIAELAEYAAAVADLPWGDPEEIADFCAEFRKVAEHLLGQIFELEERYGPRPFPSRGAGGEAHLAPIVPFPGGRR